MLYWITFTLLDRMNNNPPLCLVILTKFNSTIYLGDNRKNLWFAGLNNSATRGNPPVYLGFCCTLGIRARTSPALTSDPASTDKIASTDIKYLASVPFSNAMTSPSASRKVILGLSGAALWLLFPIYRFLIGDPRSFIDHFGHGHSVNQINKVKATLFLRNYRKRVRPMRQVYRRLLLSEPRIYPAEPHSELG